LRIALHGRPFKEEFIPYIKQIFAILASHNAKIYLNKSYASFLTKSQLITKNQFPIFSSFKDFPDCDFVFSIGGDGTLLESVTFIGEKQIPILGFNIGRLGYLATISTNEIGESLNRFFNGKYTLEPRTLVQLETDKDLFGETNFGLNEVTILKRDTSSMIIIHTYIDGVFLNSYWADGLMVATPTGSTGYSLSVGGPVVLPTCNNFIIAPINPHSLSVRPLIVSDNAVISFKIEGRSKNFLVSIDSRSAKVDANVKLVVKKANFNAVLVQIDGTDYFQTLRTKLNWGIDVRN
jgi:NAD+ kinase